MGPIHGLKTSVNISGWFSTEYRGCHSKEEVVLMEGGKNGGISLVNPTR